MKKAVLIIPAVAIAAVLGALAQRWFVPAPEAAPVAAPTVDTESPLVAGIKVEGANATPVPHSLPAFALPDSDGTVRNLDEWAGRPLMVNFWATWCGPCREEIPLLNELRAEALAPNLEVIGIAVDFRDDVLAYTKETPIDYPVLIGEEEGFMALQALGMQPALPITVFADSQHRILMVKMGELHRDEAELILGQLAAVDAGGVTLAEARSVLDAGLKDLATRRATAAAAAPAGAAKG